MDTGDYVIAMTFLKEIQEALKPAGQLIMVDGAYSFSQYTGYRFERLLPDRGTSISVPTRLISVKFQLWGEDNKISLESLTLDLFREEGCHRTGTCSNYVAAISSNDSITDTQLDGMDWKQAICHFLRVVIETARVPQREGEHYEDFRPILAKFL